MKKIKLFLMATKIEYKWFLIKLIRKRKERLHNRLSKSAEREKELKSTAAVVALNYENLSGYREAA